MALVKGDGAVNKLWNRTTVVVYFDIDISVGLLFKLRGEWFEVWIPTKTGAFLLFKTLHTPLGPTNRYCGSFTEVQWPGPAVDRSNSSSAEGKNGASEFPFHQIRLTGIYSVYFSFSSVDTVAGPAVWRLRVATVWLVTASGMCYCSNILTVKMGKW